ncbi:MAG: DUF333 domain-containing protein [Methanotrichaceae archaeon]|nr:DUF333 domain-containing protein [Methanotrichaceae archaeon]
MEGFEGLIPENLESQISQYESYVETLPEINNYQQQPPFEQFRNTYQDKSEQLIGLANPASVYCERQGGRLEIRQTPEGEIGYCILPDGTVCEEWAFYRGDCGPSPGPDDSPEPNTDGVDVIVVGRVVRVNMAGPTSNNNYVLIDVLRANPASVIMPGSRIMVRADEYATLHDCVVGRCYEFPGTWMNDALWQFRSKGHYPTLMACPDSDHSDGSDGSNGNGQKCIEGPIGSCRCQDNKIVLDYQRADCTTYTEVIRDCNQYSPPKKCVDYDGCNCVSEGTPKCEGKITAYCISKGDYTLPQTITADVQVRNIDCGTDPKFTVKFCVQPHGGSPLSPAVKSKLVYGTEWFTAGSALQKRLDEVPTGSYDAIIELVFYDINHKEVLLDRVVEEDRFRILEDGTVEGPKRTGSPLGTCESLHGTSDSSAADAPWTSDDSFTGWGRDVDWSRTKFGNWPLRNQ